jgi:hypothetical protein
MKSCENCIHCVDNGTDKRCHRNPPIASPYGESFFPRIPQNFSYCGEFTEKEKTIIEELNESKATPKKTKTKKEKKNELA